jgi:hypothetical protein
VCGAAIGRHGSFQSVVAAVSLYYVFCKRSLHRYHEKEELDIWEQGGHGIRAPCICTKEDINYILILQVAKPFL